MAQADSRSNPVIAIPELIAMVASLMALNALSIDIMLPALPDIGEAFELTDPNRRQLVVIVYLFGFGLAQLVYGPLADSYGRKGVLLSALGGFMAATLLCIIAPTFLTLLIARTLQGVAAAATRVIAMAVVRDLVHGRRMARVISLAMTVFMAAPILAPSLGQLILFGGEWHWIFGALLAAGAGLFIWIFTRLPETLAVEDRSEFRLMPILKNYAIACSHRITLGYMLASSLIFAALFSFIATSEQIMAQQYSLGAVFPLAFAGIAGGLSISNFINARMVEQVGQRRLSHGALILFILISGGHALLISAGIDGFWVFYSLLFAAMFLFGMIGANFSSLVMEPAGKRAGVTSAAYGAATSTISAVIGGFIGAAYAGTAFPLVFGDAILGVLALVIIFATERGKLFGAEEYEDEEDGAAA